MKKLEKWRIRLSSIKAPRDARQFHGGHAIVSKAFLLRDDEDDDDEEEEEEEYYPEDEDEDEDEDDEDDEDDEGGDGDGEDDRGRSGGDDRDHAYRWYGRHRPYKSYRPREALQLCRQSLRSDDRIKEAVDQRRGAEGELDDAEKDDEEEFGVD
ncbi:hypothetical protein FRC05_008777, partial [Tulasnella sp. 425]